MNQLMALLYIKAIHIIFVVSWFAGLFYIVRLFIYHTEANDRPEAERRVLIDQFKIMQRKLWYIITTPSMVLTVASGVAMLIIVPSYLQAPWMHVKLSFVVALLVYHFFCHRLLNQLKRDQIEWSSLKLRMLNEVATVLLVAIVFAVVLKNSTGWLWGVGGIFLFGVLMMVLVKWFNRDSDQ